jgi:hypothetical protein
MVPALRGMGIRRSARSVVAVGIVLLFQAMTSATHATTITVTSTADSGPGTLRAALASAGNNNVIDFALTYPATITLTGGELFVTNNITIAGPGAANLTISANNSSRVFTVGTSNTVTMSNLTIASGLASAGGVGAGIYVDHATLTLMDCIVSNNNATGGSTAAGGGIYSNVSHLTLTGCAVETNSAGGNGGGIYSGFASTLILSDSAIGNNSALTGGGVYNASGAVTATSCLIRGNAATHGGGIANIDTGFSTTLTVNNCTLTDNIVSGSSATGSQIDNSRQSAGTSAKIVSSDEPANYVGGAIYNSNGATVTVGNSILQAGAQEHTIITTIPGTVTSAGYNLSTDNGGGFLTGAGDQINTDPLLDPNGLRDNGGPTQTIALQANSSAIDKGKRDTITALAISRDQRGDPRPFDDPNIANATGGDGSDIGAYEVSRVRVTDVEKLGTDLLIGFDSVVGRTYQLQSQSGLMPNGWNPLGGPVPGNGGVTQITVSNAFSQPVQFYRVEQASDGALPVPGDFHTHGRFSREVRGKLQ